MDWHYERLDAQGKIESVYSGRNDIDGKLTGRCVMNVKAWFDENPAERIKRGWTKHITYSGEEIKQKAPYNPRTQYLVVSQKQVDDWTVEDEYHVVNKSEEMILFEQQLALVQGFDPDDGGIQITF